MYRQRPRRPPRGGAYFRSSQALAANVPCAASRVQPCRRMAAICLIAAHRLIDLRGCCASVTVAGGREAGHCQAGAGELSHLAGIPAPRNSRRGSPGARPRPSAGLRRTENVGSQLLSLLQCPARGIVSAISGVAKKPKRRLRHAARIKTPRDATGWNARSPCLPPDETVHGARDSVPPGLANAGSGPAADNASAGGGRLQPRCRTKRAHQYVDGPHRSLSCG